MKTILMFLLAIGLASNTVSAQGMGDWVELDEDSEVTFTWCGLGDHHMLDTKIIPHVTVACAIGLKIEAHYSSGNPVIKYSTTSPADEITAGSYRSVNLFGLGFSEENVLFYRTTPVIWYLGEVVYEGASLDLCPPVP